MSNYSTEEHLVASVWVHDTWHTGQTMNLVMTVFQQQFGKPSPCRETLNHWQTHLFIWEYKILCEVAHQYLEQWCVLLSLNNHCTHLGHIQQNSEYCIWLCLWTWRRTWRWSQFSHAKVCNETQLCWHELPSWSMCFADGTNSNSLVSWRISFQMNT